MGDKFSLSLGKLQIGYRLRIFSNRPPPRDFIFRNKSIVVLPSFERSSARWKLRRFITTERRNGIRFAV
jgi:hypothetical protein